MFLSVFVSMETYTRTISEKKKEHDMSDGEYLCLGETLLHCHVPFFLYPCVLLSHWTDNRISAGPIRRKVRNQDQSDKTAFRFKTKMDMIFTARKRSLGQGNIFYTLFVILFTGGHAWLLWGGVVAPGGACMVAPGGAWMVALGGHAWFYSGSMCGFIQGDMHVFIQGHAWFYSGGACMVFSVFSDTMRYGPMSGRYASYWNAILVSYMILLAVISCTGLFTAC